MAYVTPGTVAAGDVATAAAWNVLTNDVIDHESRLAPLAPPRGIMGGTTLATAFVTSSTSPTDITGLSVTFTAVASRQYKISIYATIEPSAAANSRIYIVKSSTLLCEIPSPRLASPVNTAMTGFAFDTPGAGSVTYKAQVDVTSGTTTVYATAQRASIAARLIVEDIGAA